ncbi:Hypothetical predicted protein, partial [Podarcis lilfordi]
KSLQQFGTIFEQSGKRPIFDEIVTARLRDFSENLFPQESNRGLINWPMIKSLPYSPPNLSGKSLQPFGTIFEQSGKRTIFDESVTARLSDVSEKSFSA